MCYDSFNQTKGRMTVRVITTETKEVENFNLKKESSTM